MSEVKKVKEEEAPVVLKKIKHKVGAIVYLITDPFQLRRMVIKVYLGPIGYEYELRHSDSDPSTHYHIEISEEKGEVEAGEEAE